MDAQPGLLEIKLAGRVIGGWFNSDYQPADAVHELSAQEVVNRSSSPLTPGCNTQLFDNEHIVENTGKAAWNGICKYIIGFCGAERGNKFGSRLDKEA